MPAEPADLREDLRQTRPFRSKGHEATVAILHTADRVRGLLSGNVEPHGITLQQYNVLRILRGAGDEGLPTLEIAERMIERSPGVTRLLDRLEAKGLVRRERCREDRRQVLCYIHPLGLDLLAELDPQMDEADRRPVAGLSEEQVGELAHLLGLVRAALPR